MSESNRSSNPSNTLFRRLAETCCHAARTEDCACCDAMTEIERLTAELAARDALDGEWQPELDRLRIELRDQRRSTQNSIDEWQACISERDRLRAALELIVKEYEPGYSTWDFVGYAKNALAGVTDETTGEQK